MDLDGKEALDYGSSTPFVPWGNGLFDFVPKKFYKFKGRNQDAYRCTIEILKSSRDDVQVGGTYCLHWPIVTGKGDKDEAKRAAIARALRGFFAAMHEEDPSNKDFKAGAALQEAIDLGDDLAKAGVVMRLSRTQGETKEGKSVSNDRFEAVSE